MRDTSHSNGLAGETSPYLLQHAHNPVDWHPWNEQVLQLARTRRVPILLSIGYSACHWCHVMAHESFEDPATAELMNRLYINIKVDREERPDLDRVYQLAHQLLAQRGGGWPLTVFLTPDDLTPFFAGTYFPSEPRYGMPAFREVLTRVSDFYHAQRDQLQQQNASLRELFMRIEREHGPAAEKLRDMPVAELLAALSNEFDAKHGGFGPAPKFPRTPALELLLQTAADTRMQPVVRDTARSMLTTTLTRMAEGGIYDQLGGGFCRYSVDAEWSIPHFEKMLYDNGPLLALYAQAWLFTRDPDYLRVAQGIARWVMTEMQSSKGGYFASLDADSDGHEGSFYLWDMQEVQARLTTREYAVFAPHYGLDRPANFEGRWHLRVCRSPQETPGPADTTPDLETALLESARAKLLMLRALRTRPGLDDKVLTAWNGLMIAGMACSGRLLQQQEWIESAERAARFIHAELWKQGRLLASWRGKRTDFPGYLDDHAFLLDGLLELLQARWNTRWLDWAQALADTLLLHFQDRDQGGFWFTADDQQTPLYRPRNYSDESMPSGNAIAARSLVRLGHICAEPKYLQAGERALKAALPSANRVPDAHLSTFTALSEALQPPLMIILRGKPPELQDWMQELDRQYAPRRMLLAIPQDAAGLQGRLAECAPQGDICAYLCRGTHCSLPITSIEKLQQAISA
ncbi:MAG: thioredoxin domain-containing protein [Gammaproteobacteria bacterium]|nr:thioredoxin domain-containing protein [Gammaproteobacteria bacterium]